MGDSLIDFHQPVSQRTNAWLPARPPFGHLAGYVHPVSGGGRKLAKDLGGLREALPQMTQAFAPVISLEPLQKFRGSRWADGKGPGLQKLRPQILVGGAMHLR
jgi:hypothetical protein